MRFIFIFMFTAVSFGAGADPNLIERQTFLSPPPQVSKGLVKVAFFDADSTLRISKSGLPWATYDTDFIILPGVAAKIRELNAQNFVVAIVSNQGRIPESLPFKEADEAFYNLVRELQRSGAKIHYFDFAEHVDGFRKPNAGMFDRLEMRLSEYFQRKTRIDRESSMMIGDAAYKRSELRPDGSPGQDFSNADRGFAERAKIKFIEAANFFGWTRFGFTRIDTRHQARLIERRCAREFAFEATAAE